ncbi:Peptide deformylase [Ruegeria sp. TM1040]|uniref:peptide deformylase n=1 Tax=Ruegeria sp. (strain TM1040) TaxID=292414 RepID=UPI00004631A0|nr:peptide deformylase [Ruegeria sp. TM1040]ABF65311.1 Peptide deformylase [Ruegeria sp. TM1040]
MSLLPIVQWPDPRLSTACAPVGAAEDLGTLIDDVLETMYAAPGRGLAAPQVGVLKRVFVMDVDWKEGPRNPVVMIYPEVLWRSDDTTLAKEACLSIPGLSTRITRPTKIRIRWQDADRAAQEQTFDGFAARCIQHEYDHLDGRVTFDHFSSEERRLLEAQYLSQNEATA